MNVAAVREDLERTGVLFTQHEGDVGHIPDFWRKTILALCDVLESTPLDVADSLREERQMHQDTKDLLAKAQEANGGLTEALKRSASDVEEALAKSRSAVRLVEEAVPRMRTLNNAMSPDWLRRAEEFLGE